MVESKRIDQPTGTETVGHEWDGIEELDTPLPRWWLITFYASIVWALGYVILFPAWPMLSGATQGYLGWTSRGQLAAEMKADADRRAPILRSIAQTPIDQIPQNERLLRAAIEGGNAAFKVHCVQCHGSGGSGTPGYANLNDDDWLWGGDLATIQQTILDGVRQPDHTNTRFSQMPAFEGILSPPEIDDLVAYVRFISRQQKGNAKSVQGAALFSTNCSSCHGGNGQGLREFGAPNLTDKIWLYGGDAETIRTTIRKARFGVMPSWRGRLDPVTIKMLALYIHSKGGGEASPSADNADPKKARPVNGKP